VRSKESVDIVSENASQPIISADGKRVIYIRVLGPNQTELWVSDIDGANKVKLAASGNISTGDWSPDSSQLAFIESKGGENWLYIVRDDGRDLRQVEWKGEPLGWQTWSADGKTLYMSTVGTGSRPQVWKMNADGSHPEEVQEKGCYVVDASRDGKYFIGTLFNGKEVGIYQISIADRQIVALLPGVVTFMVRFASDGKSFLYPVVSHNEVTIYRQAWSDGKILGKPQIALKLPFAFGSFYQGGNAYDIARDFSTIVYALPGG